jgi:hypothetical protein
MYASTEWYVHDDPLNSDHAPILITLHSIKCQEGRDSTPPKYNYTKANWAVFTQRLESAVYEHDNELTIEDRYQKLRTIMIEAAEAAIPKTKPATHSKYPPNPWWNDKCRKAVQRKRKACVRYRRKQSEENYNELKESRMHCKKAVADAKCHHWQEYITKNVNDYKDTKKLWQKNQTLKTEVLPTGKAADSKRFENQKRQ